jgi:hypothetical protein
MIESSSKMNSRPSSHASQLPKPDEMSIANYLCLTPFPNAEELKVTPRGFRGAGDDDADLNDFSAFHIYDWLPFRSFCHRSSLLRFIKAALQVMHCAGYPVKTQRQISVRTYRHEFYTILHPFRSGKVLRNDSVRSIVKAHEECRLSSGR